MRTFDLNGDSAITEKELYEKLEPLCHDDEGCYAEYIDSLHMLDTNGNGKADVEEVIEYFDEGVTPDEKDPDEAEGPP